MAIFSKFIKRLQLPGEYKQAVQEIFLTERLILKSANANNLNIGDLVTFSYKGSFKSRRYLVVATEKAKRGKFVSSKGNTLICGYDLSNKETLAGLYVIFSSFYKKPRINYNSMKNTMTSIFGPDTYKTFNTAEIRNIYSLEIPQ